jgi:hypothetical protein
MSPVARYSIRDDMHSRIRAIRDTIKCCQTLRAAAAGRMEPTPKECTTAR